MKASVEKMSEKATNLKNDIKKGNVESKAAMELSK